MSGSTLLAQAAPPQGTQTAVPPPPPPAPAAPDPSVAIWVALAAVAALLLAAAVKLARRRRAPELPPAAPRRDLTPAAPAEPRREERVPSPRPPPREPPRTPEERAAEEERRREEYRAKKEAERAEKERKARERAEAEAQRKRALEEERQRREAEERERAQAEARRIEAESGKTLREGLTRTREGGFVARLSGLFGGKAEVSEATLGELEEILFTADIGVRTSMTLVEHARGKLRAREISDPGKLRSAIRTDIEAILARAQNGSAARALPGLGLPLEEGRTPWVIMVVGVNGAGKTTTIGKLASKLKARGKSVLLAAGDTFRAAATEQLDVWAERAGVPIVHGPEGGDPASVVFDAVTRARTEGVDVVIADTAGRLHTKAPLMEELKKVKRVIGKAREGAPDEVLLVLDATTGQNAIAQARQFHDALGVTGIVLTKLDGTAKGGVVIGISDELSIPVRLVGIGEKLADLRPFDPHEFVDALFDTEPAP
jgi:fused signal recognition particle receptor